MIYHSIFLKRFQKRIPNSADHVLVRKACIITPFDKLFLVNPSVSSTPHPTQAIPPFIRHYFETYIRCYIFNNSNINENLCVCVCQLCLFIYWIISNFSDVFPASERGTDYTPIPCTFARLLNRPKKLCSKA